MKIVCFGFLFLLPFAVSFRSPIKISKISNHGFFKKTGISLVDPFIVDPSYNLAAGAAVVGTIFGVLGNPGATAKAFGAGAILFTLFGGFFAFQTNSLRFTFDDKTFALVKADGTSIGENAVVGGENRWAYDTFVNWDFLPSKSFPILVYFKETQTPESSRQEIPLKVDDLDGQVHFFPAIANSAQLEENFIKFGCRRIPEASN